MEIKTSMTGNDIKFYEYTKRKAEILGLTIDIEGERIVIMREKKAFGILSNVDTVFSFLCGYEWGINNLPDK